MTSPEMSETKAYKTYRGYATGVTPPKKARKFKKLASPKLSTIPALPNKPTKKSKKVKRPAKKSTNAPTTCVVIKETPVEEAQINKTLKKSKQKTHKLQASASSEGADFESEGDSDDDNESDDNADEGSENDDDSGNDAQASERTNLDEEENPNLSLNVDKEEETQEEEYIHTTDYFVPTDEEIDDENNKFDDEEYDDLYKDVNVRSKVAEHKETEGSKQSSFVSSEFASKFIILDNVSPVVDEVASMMNVNVFQEESSTQAPPLLSVSVMEFKKKAQEEKDRYINLIQKSIKDIIKDEVKSQPPHILPKEESDFATPLIQSAINESLENVILAKSFS
nr:hypothetical protein [Tanacetum cinerariifolium]